MPFCSTLAKPSDKQLTKSYPTTCGFSHAKADKGKRDRAMIRGFRSFFIKFSIGLSLALFYKNSL
ncbi:hypothetical protein [Moraxella lacunata]|uniref:hypothetical protein n=1 Tax=Moraxella lacunata TaxID=477 RepID=UPI003EE28433